MDSVTAGLARQVLVAAAMSALVLGAVGLRPNEDRHAAANISEDKPILTRAIVFADALSQALPTPVLKSPATPKTASRPACASSPSCARLAVASAPHSRSAAEPASKPIDVADTAPSSQSDSPSLKKRLLAPVGFVRDNVARLRAWL
jgi:hypothetical protein